MNEHANGDEDGIVNPDVNLDSGEDVGVDLLEEDFFLLLILCLVVFPGFIFALITRKSLLLFRCRPSNCF